MTDPHSHPRYQWKDTDGNVDRFNAALDEYMMRGEEEAMRGIHDGPDCTTWPDPKEVVRFRNRVLLAGFLVIVFGVGVGALAGVQDGPEGVDPLGGRSETVFGDVVTVGPDNVYPHGGINDSSMTCSREQENRCVSICQDAAKPGEIASSSACKKRFVPAGPMPGMVMEWYCVCTWVKAPVTAGR